MWVVSHNRGYDICIYVFYIARIKAGKKLYMLYMTINTSPQINIDYVVSWVYVQFS